jgi:molybdenum cofactor cytidylyltransferase
MKEVLFAHTSCIILSAGSSARMGTHKALLKFDSERTFLQKITETYSLAGIEQVIVVVHSELYKLIKKSDITLSEKVLLVINDKPELGRFYSLQTGIKHLKTGNYCFFQNIDNPFISEAWLNELIIHKGEADVIMPVFEERKGHPVLINPKVVQEIASTIDYDVRIDAFLKQFAEKRVEIQDRRIPLNINSKEDYLKAGFII